MRPRGDRQHHRPPGGGATAATVRAWLARDVEVVEAAGREVRITSPGKVFFPERGETKLDLVRYYLAVEEPIMRAMAGRPTLLQRFPEGAGGSNFFQKRVPDERARLARRPPWSAR